VIEVQGLTKSYGARVALSDISLAARPGEILALLGPNGAGKTTTVRLLLGLLTPDAGTIRVAGLDPGVMPAEVRARVGLVSESPGFYLRLDARQNLRFFGRLHGIEEAPLAARSESLLAAMGLADRGGDPVGNFSRGMKQRLALARGLLHDPEVLLLDEPTQTLDPEAAAAVRTRLEELRDRGKTLLLCTHNLEEAARLAGRVAILKTTLLACDTPERLRRGSGPRRIALQVSRLGGTELTLLQSLPYLKGFELSHGRIRAAMENPDRDVPALVKKLVELGSEVRDVHDDDPTLEEVYLSLVKEA
jgi:ABC-2 type transport system ATP-binding protein